MPTLLIMAAGIGSRYQGLKQLDTFGPNGEPLFAYAMYDAWKAGFGKVVFVIRKEIREAFEEKVMQLVKGKMTVQFAYQELTDIPAGLSFPAGRKKPWGTGHAIWAARHIIHEPFAVINADDFYGRGAYEVMANFLAKKRATDTQYGMVGYELARTLSEYGTVSRGICEIGEKNMLRSIVERTKIMREGDHIMYEEADGTMGILPPKNLVSMNFWGFTPKVFEELSHIFSSFLSQNHLTQHAELHIPTAINTMLNQDHVGVDLEVLTADTQWFGVTYQADKELAKRHLLRLIEKGEYPFLLW